LHFLIAATTYYLPTKSLNIKKVPVNWWSLSKKTLPWLLS
jgi:hypothetical protein